MSLWRPVGRRVACIVAFYLGMAAATAAVMFAAIMTKDDAARLQLIALGYLCGAVTAAMGIKAHVDISRLRQDVRMHRC